MKTGWIEQRDGVKGTTYRARYWLPDAEGKPEPKSKSFPSWRYPTKEEAKKAATLFLAKTLVEIEGGSFVAPSELTLGDYLDRWLETKTDAIRPNSVRAYAHRLAHVRAALGSTPLQKLKPMQIQSTYARFRAAGMGTANVNAIHTVLTAALAQAVKWELIPRSPMPAVTPPRDTPKPTAFWQPEATGAFLAAVEGDPADITAWRLLALTGMRVGELAALELKDVDLDKGTIRIRRTMTQDRAGRHVVGDAPKSRNGLRTIPIPAGCREELRAQKIRQRERRLAARDWQTRSGDLLFGEGDGGPLNYGRFRRRFRDACAAAGVAVIGLHGLRHSFVSALYHAGISPLVIAALVGDSVATILRVYGHVLDGAREEAIATIEALIAAPPPNREEKG